VTDFLPGDGDEPPKQRILIVDDDEMLRELFRVTMSAAGFDVAGAPDGLTALTILDQFQPDLIALDLMMPRMDGHQFCGKLAERGVRVPIIIVSAFWSPVREAQ